MNPPSLVQSDSEQTKTDNLREISLDLYPIEIQTDTPIPTMIRVP